MAFLAAPDRLRVEHDDIRVCTRIAEAKGRTRVVQQIADFVLVDIEQLAVERGLGDVEVAPYRGAGTFLISVRNVGRHRRFKPKKPAIFVEIHAETGLY
jgi:hypothetical protein